MINNKEATPRDLDELLNEMAGITGGSDLVDISDNQILYFGIKPDTVDKKVKDVQKWHEFMLYKGWGYPIEVKQLGIYLMSLVYWGLVKSTIQAKVTNLIEFLVNTTGCLPDSPLTIPRLLYVRKKVAYAAVAKDATKAAVMMINDKWQKLNIYDITILIIWFLTTLRGDSFTEIQDSDFIYANECIKVRVAEDKVKNVTGRTQIFCCTCKGNFQKPFIKNDDVEAVVKACPVHGLPRLKFPILKTKANEILKYLKLTMHSVRRSAASALRAATVDSQAWSLKSMAEHFGWELKATKWNEYTKDFDKDIMTLDKFPCLEPIIIAFGNKGVRNTSYDFKASVKTEEKILADAKKRWELLHKDTVNKYRQETAWGLSTAAPSMKTALERIEDETEFVKAMQRGGGLKKPEDIKDSDPDEDKIESDDGLIKMQEDSDSDGYDEI